MKHKLYQSSLIIAIIVTSFTIKLNAQQAEGIQKKLLVRDSLDFKHANTGFNTNAKEFNPIPFKDGLLFVSNKKTEVNKLGFNKVYWIPKSLIGKKDSLSRSFSLNDDFTAPTSNDNNILYRFNRKKLRASNNVIENKFADFIPEESFSIDDTASYIIFTQLSKRKIAGDYKWELWEANLVDGKLKNAKKIQIQDSAADYMHPFLTSDKSTLYFSSNRMGGKGGFDIYSLNRVNGVWNRNPVKNECINTISDELSPTLNGFDLLFSSNRTGGLGGFDLYRASIQPSLKACSVSNLGYPINTNADDASILQLNNEFYLSRSKMGASDIASIQYKPVFIPVNGKLIFGSDLSLYPNQTIFVIDNDTKSIIDSLKTDINATYQFKAKPNRNYSLLVKNADGIEESISLNTTEKIEPHIYFAANLKGRSPKQIKDSTERVWAAIEQKRQDSIAASSLDSKFIVYYGFDKSVLTTKEKLVLDSLYNKLQKMPSTYLIVGAFTDCVGSFKYNYALSVKRAKYVVQYLKKKGLAPNRFVSNGYSKNYTISPCLVKLNKKDQQNNRRAEIVLSTVGNTNWAKLEKERGKSYYAVYSSKNNIKSVKLTQQVLVQTSPKLVNSVIADTLSNLKVATVAGAIKSKKNTSIAKTPILKNTIAVTSSPAPVKMEQQKSVDNNKLELKKDTVKTTITQSAKVTSQTVVKEVINKQSQIALPSTFVDDEISKDEILVALDSLAKLKIEQERIVEYLTKRINKKPIDVLVSSDSVTIEIYDNAIHDKDSVSIIFNNRIIVDKQELKVNKPIRFTLKVDKNKKFNEMIMVAENLGAEPPNTAVMFVTEKNGRRQQVLLSTDMQHNEVVYFIRIGKEK